MTNERDPGDEENTPVEIPMPRTISKPRMEVVIEPIDRSTGQALDEAAALRGVGRDPAIHATTDGQPPAPGFEDKGAPQPIEPRSGQHGAYWVLSAEERAKGYVRPVRSSYIHDGIPAPRGELRDLTRDEAVRFAGVGYVKFEPYPESERPTSGRFWTQAQIDKIGKGCGTVTTMGSAIAETYAAQPSYYGSTFCVGCRVHLPVGAGGEFTWIDPRTRRPELRDGKPWRVGT